MKTIYKFQLTPHEKQTIPMPEGAVILHADNQREKICIWCELETENKTTPRMIEVFGTGHEMNEEPETERIYIGSVKMQNGTFIFHIYERIS